MKLKDMNNLELNKIQSWKFYPDKKLKRDFIKALGKMNYQVFVYTSVKGGGKYYNLYVVKQGSYRPHRHKDFDTVVMTDFESFDYEVKTERAGFIKFIKQFIVQVEWTENKGEK